MKRILVTGGRGFLGSAVVSELKSSSPDAEIFTLDRTLGGKRHIHANLGDLSAVRRTLRRVRPSLVFHMAGGDKTQAWPELWDAHVRATYNLLEGVRALPGEAPRVVLAGSSLEYGLRGWGKALSEETLPKPESPYGWSKLEQSLAALSYVCLGVPVIVARVFNALGPGLSAHHAAASFSRQIALIEAGRKKSLKVAGDLKASRDFLDVADVARAFRLLALKGQSGEIYNVSSGRSTRVGELLDILISFAWVPIRVERPNKRLKRSSPPIWGSFAKLRAATGWKPEVALKTSLRAMLEHWRGRE